MFGNSERQIPTLVHNNSKLLFIFLVKSSNYSQSLILFIKKRVTLHASCRFFLYFIIFLFQISSSSGKLQIIQALHCLLFVKQWFQLQQRYYTKAAEFTHTWKIFLKVTVMIQFIVQKLISSTASISFFFPSLSPTSHLSYSLSPFVFNLSHYTFHLRFLKWRYNSVKVEQKLDKLVFMSFSLRDNIPMQWYLFSKSSLDFKHMSITEIC